MMPETPLPSAIDAEIPAFLSFADELADAAALITLKHFRERPEVENKASRGFDPVTIADRDAERVMRQMIRKSWPDHIVDGEEDGIDGGPSPWRWTLDPIDGTRAFISGLPTWGILIGLSHEGAPVIGCMDQPFTRERWRGWTGASLRGADHRDASGRKPIRTRACGALADATLSTTDPGLFVGTDQPAFQAVKRHVRLTRYGLDCYAYAMVAMGHMDLVIEAGLKPHDIAALVPIVEGAGGRITNWSGGRGLEEGKAVAVADAALLAQTLEALNGAH
jgi:histidinol phosphatase-like enzyme (inositol monophosphatase family)